MQLPPSSTRTSRCEAWWHGRVAFFGQSYDREAAGPIPTRLLPLRSDIAAWAGVRADSFAMALLNEYRPGSPVGHPARRDAPGPWQTD